MGFGLMLPGQVMAWMFFALMAMTVGIATAAADGDQTGGQHGAAGLELFLSGGEEPVDQSGMFWHFHSDSGDFLALWNYDKYIVLSDTSLKTVLATTFFEAARARCAGAIAVRYPESGKRKREKAICDGQLPVKTGSQAVPGYHISSCPSGLCLEISIMARHGSGANF
jgi:hypothetical protein